MHIIHQYSSFFLNLVGHFSNARFGFLIPRIVLRLKNGGSKFSISTNKLAPWIRGSNNLALIRLK
jgi:hypothetical protein